MSFNVWTEKSFHKIFPSETPKSSREEELFCAKNEKEGCQIVLLSDVDTVATLDFSEMIGEGGVISSRKHEVLFISAGKFGYFSDPMRPLNDSTVSLKGGEAKAIFWRFDVPKDAEAGKYSASVTVTAEGCQALTVKVNLNVWNFTLPDTPSCQSAFGLHRKALDNTYGFESGSEESQRMYESYYEELLDYRISAYELPYDIRTDKADKYMDDPRVTSFMIPFVKDDKVIAEYFDKLRTKRDWFKKGYFYDLDEPCTEQAYEQMKSVSAYLRGIEPNFRRVMPFYMNPPFDIELNAVDSMLGNVNIWCPESCTWDNLNEWDKLGRGPDDSLGPRMKARQAAGDTVWWYVCCGPREPYCNLHITMSGIMHRILFWQQMSKGVEGLLYWCANYWNEDDFGDWSCTRDPWTDMATVKKIDKNLYGDGSLFYPGEDGPCPSLRLECVRDGIEDFEYLTMASRLFGQKYVDDIIASVSPSLTVYTDDEDLFYATRIVLGNAIENALNK